MTHDDVRAMLGELKISRLLAGYRGSSPADIDRVADAVLRIAALATALGSRVESLAI